MTNIQDKYRDLIPESQYDEIIQNYEKLSQKNIDIIFEQFELALQQYEKRSFKFSSMLFISLYKNKNIKNREILKKSLLNYSSCLKCLNKLSEANLSYDNYLIKYGKNFEVLYNKANLKESQGEFSKALLLYQEAEKYNPNSIENKINIAECYVNIGEFKKAEQIYIQLLDLNINNPALNSALSLLYLRQGRYDIGWKLYSWRLKNEAQSHNFPFKMTDEIWNALISEEYIKNRDEKISIISEQGIGDTVMFSSILNEISYINDLTGFIDKRLMVLFQNSFPNVKWNDIEQYQPNLINNQKLLPIGELGRLFRYDSKMFNSKKFLKPHYTSVNWFSKYIVKDKLNIGISWMGGTQETRMNHRSIEFDKFIRIFENLNVNLINLQHNQTIPIENQNMISNVSKQELLDINNLAQLIENLDLVVTVQNTNVHLAGALDVKCIVALPFVAEWRYGSTDKMPWYNSVTLVRQNKINDWDYVINSIRSLLLQELAVSRKK